MKHLLISSIFFVLLQHTSPLFAGLPVPRKNAETERVLIQQCLTALNEVLIRDITSPPVASRNYLYTCVAFYEASRHADPKYSSFSGQLKALEPLPGPESRDMDWLVAGAWSFYFTSKQLVFSKQLFEEQWLPIAQTLQERCPNTAQFNRSKAYGAQVAQHILQWSTGDGYSTTRSLTRYTPLKTPDSWQQTPPAYMAGVEPNWNKIRPLVLERADEFKPVPPTPYNQDPQSAYFKDVKQVYDITTTLTPAQKEIANFWDCNPWAAQFVGHVSYAIKKISPGGHWMGITGIAIQRSKLGMVPALQSYSMVAIGLFDAFISCWDEKYRSNYIRPITAIQALIDPTWEPLLQTPPFPEYTSGHSVASKSASTILSALFGHPFPFEDTVEIPYGLPSRTFDSFEQAAQEAAISRLYGGIHFMPAIQEGAAMGEKVGRKVLTHIKLKE